MKPSVILFDEIEYMSSFQSNKETGIAATNEILAQVRGKKRIVCILDRFHLMTFFFHFFVGMTTFPHGYLQQSNTLNNNENILLLGTTNQPWLLEERLRRVFTYNIHVRLPDEKPRQELFRMFLQNLKHNITEEQFNCLISKSEG